ncbi:MAG: hypothetical protein GX270_15365 [Clostridiaceae bacterium]|jgi:hypothetical protein|nr:hypothetical protein [Clostridiaceae bacterium]
MKSINKALIYRDWKYTKWFMPIIFIVLLFSMLINISGDSYGDLIVNEFGFNIGTWIVVAMLLIMTSIMFSFDRNLSSYSLAASMPFTRKEIILSKWFVGAYNLLIPFSSVYVILNMILIVNNCWLDKIGFVTFSITFNLMFLLCVFGFFIMIQAINGTVFLGSFISALFIAIPYSFVHIIHNIYSFYQGRYLVPSIIVNTEKVMNSIFIFITYILNINPLVDADTIKYLKQNPIDELMILVNYEYHLKCIGLAFYIVSLIVLFKLSIKLFSKSKSEINGRITTVNGVNKIYKIVLAYYTGYLLHTLFAGIFDGAFYRLDLVVLFYFVLPIPLYFLMGKIIVKYNRRNE